MTKTTSTASSSNARPSTSTRGKKEATKKRSAESLDQPAMSDKRTPKPITVVPPPIQEEMESADDGSQNSFELAMAQESNGESDPEDEDLGATQEETQPSGEGTRATKRRKESSKETIIDLVSDTKEHSDQTPIEERQIEDDNIVIVKRPKPGVTTTNNGKVLISEPDVMLKTLDYYGVNKFKEEWYVISPEVRQCMDIAQHIAPEFHPILDTIPPLGHSGTDWVPQKTGEWRKYSNEEFFQFLINWLPRSNEQNQLGQTAEERLLQLQIMNFRGMALNPIVQFLTRFFREFASWETENYNLPAEEKARKVGKIISEIIKNTKKKSSEKSVTYELTIALELHGTFKVPAQFGAVLLNKAKEIICTISNALKYGMKVKEGDQAPGTKPKEERKGGGAGSNQHQAGKPFTNHGGGRNNKDFPAACTGCGRTNHLFADCNLKHHQDFNSDRNVAWADSPSGKAWATMKNREGKPFLVLPGKMTLAAMKNGHSNHHGGHQQGNFRRFNNKKCKSLSLLALTANKNLTERFPFPYIRGTITALSGNELEKPIPIKVLLDTGALNANYISSYLLKELEVHDITNVTIKIIPTQEKTMSADNSILECTGSITCSLDLQKSENAKISVNNTVLKVIHMHYDVILGLPTIKTHNLITEHFSSLFSTNQRQNISVTSSVDTQDRGESSSEQEDQNNTFQDIHDSLLTQAQLTAHTSSAELLVDHDGSRGNRSDVDGSVDHVKDHIGGPFSVGELDDKSTTPVAVCEKNLPHPNHNVLLLIRSKEQALGITRETEDEISQQWEDDYILEDVLHSGESLSEGEILGLINFEGDTEVFNQRIKEVCRKYIKVFRKELNKEAATIPPFEIQVDRAKWEQNENRQPPRKQGPVKEKEIFRQVSDMLKHGVIRPSNSAEFSQVLLTPKPGGEWRFCIDFRRLNEATTQIGWPLPNIKSMLHRLGSKQAKYFGKMDFTKGYFQAALAESSRRYTAFITYCGIYEWLRVPMGLKGAPSYFQFMIATVVLAGLLYICCELYIDDVIVYGKNEDEFLDNLEKVLQRLQERNVSLNPKKCQLGASEIEFVGHVIDKEGLKMSEAKLSKVIEFKKPVVAKGLKSFLGLANYFRDHIKNHSQIVRPLQDMIKHYKKGHKLTWNEETSKAFNEIKNAINNCPKIFFVQDHAPIFLHTDASKYAIGAYLFQIIKDKEFPIAFLSKTLTDSQLNWSTFEKEAYAIYYAFHELEYLIHDRKFTLRTDHANLTFIKDSGSEKVRRWKLYIQDYNFDIEHIKGEHNIVADAFSRLVEEPSDPDHLLNLTQDSIIPQPIYKAIGKCHNSIVGHHGVQRTVDKLEAMGFKTKYLAEYVKLFVKRCPACQKMSQIKPVIETIPFTTAAYAPMHKISMDTIGPLPESSAGYKHILVIIDCFSRWVELYPCRTVEAEEAAKHLIEFVGRFGCPKEIISDNGTQFVNEVIDNFIKLFGAQHLLTIPHSKQENAIVERVNKEIMKHLRHWIYDKNLIKEWEDARPFIQRIINTAVHSSTGYSPAQIIYGNRINMDRNIILSFEVAEHNVPLPIYVAKMAEMQRKIVHKAMLSQLLKDNVHKANFNKLPTEYKVGTYVLALYPENRMGRLPPTKFHTQWKGPMQVVNSIGSKYTVRNLVTGKLEDYHVTSLKHFTMDIEHTNVEDVAQKDYKTWITEAVRDHRPKKKGRDLRRSRLQFLIKWEGYPEEENTWEPWSNLRRNKHVHQYMRAHGMGSLIPKNLREVPEDTDSASDEA